MLLHPRVKSLTVAFPLGSPEGFETLISSLPGRAPNLEVLDIRSEIELLWDDENSENHLIDGIRPLTRLRKLILPAFWLTTRVMEALSVLPASTLR